MLENKSILNKQEMIQSTLKAFPNSTRKWSRIWIVLFTINCILSFEEAFIQMNIVSFIVFIASIIFIIINLALVSKTIHQKVLKLFLKEKEVVNQFSFDQAGFTLLSNQSKSYDSVRIAYSEVRGFSYNEDYFYIALKKNPSALVLKTNSFTSGTKIQLLELLRSKNVQTIGKNPIDSN